MTVSKQQIFRIFNGLFCLLSLAGIIFSLVLFYEGTQPCSGDGCIIQILVVIGLVCLLISGPVFYVTIRKEKHYWQNEDSNA